HLGDGAGDICRRIYGTGGTFDSHYFGEVAIRGHLPYKGGKMENLYTEGAVANIAAFHDSIVRGDFSNPTVAPSVRSTLTTIVGRTAALRQAEGTWGGGRAAGEKPGAERSRARCGPPRASRGRRPAA